MLVIEEVSHEETEETLLQTDNNDQIFAYFLLNTEIKNYCTYAAETEVV